jgi:excisionase family DNA binding protein
MSALQPEVTSIKTAMAETTLSRGTLYTLMREGKLKSVKIGGRRLIMRDSLRDLLASAS